MRVMCRSHVAVTVNIEPLAKVQCIDWSQHFIECISDAGNCNMTPYKRRIKNDIQNLLAKGYLTRHKIKKKQPRIKPRVGLFGNSLFAKVKRDNENKAVRNSGCAIWMDKFYFIQFQVQESVKARLDNNLGFLLSKNDHEKLSGRLRPAPSYISLPLHNDAADIDENEPKNMAERNYRRNTQNNTIIGHNEFRPLPSPVASKPTPFAIPSSTPENLNSLMVFGGSSYRSALSLWDHEQPQSSHTNRHANTQRCVTPYMSSINLAKRNAPAPRQLPNQSIFSSQFLISAQPSTSKLNEKLRYKLAKRIFKGIEGAKEKLFPKKYSVSKDFDEQTPLKHIPVAEFQPPQSLCYQRKMQNFNESSLQTPRRNFAPSNPFSDSLQHTPFSEFEPFASSRLPQKSSAAFISPFSVCKTDAWGYHDEPKTRLPHMDRRIMPRASVVATVTKTTHTATVVMQYGSRLNDSPSDFEDSVQQGIIGRAFERRQFNLAVGNYNPLDFSSDDDSIESSISVFNE